MFDCASSTRLPHRVPLFDGLVLVGIAAASFMILPLVGPISQGDASNVAIIYPPWIGGSDALKRTADAGAVIVRQGRFPFIVIGRATSTSFASAARRHGAVMLLDARAARGCFLSGSVT